MGAKNESSAEVLQSSPRFMDRLLPPRSFRRAATIAGGCIMAVSSVLHYEVGRLQDSQETGINGVRIEVANQGAGIKDPLLVKLDEADQTMEEAKERLEICKDVANKLGITVTEEVEAGSEQAAAPNVEPGSTTTTTVVDTP